MPLCLHDAKILGSAVKKARNKKHLTQAECAQLLGFSLSFQKDVESGRFSPSLENFYRICRILNISADKCIFFDMNSINSEYQKMIQTMSKYSRSQLQVLLSISTALLENDNTGDEV